MEHLKEDNKVFIQRMEKIGINIDDVVAGFQILPRIHRLKNYNDYSITLMALGFNYFKTIKAPALIFEAIELKTLADAMGDYADSKRFKDWKAYSVKSGVSITKMYAKMRWFKQKKDLKKKDEKIAEMAFGSAVFILHQIKPIWPSSIRDDDKIEDQLERLINQLPEAEKSVGEPNVKGKLRAIAENPV